MKLRYKILLGFFGVVAAGVLALAVAISYTADCPPAPAVEPGTETMQALRARCYGSPDVLTIEDVPRPVPAADQMLVRVRAAGVNPLDYHYMRGSPYLMRLMAGIGRPDSVAVGVDFAGIVEAVGDDVDAFAVGDAVFGWATGAFAEYLVVSEAGPVAKKPDTASFEEAASIGVAATTALQALRDHGKTSPGDKVLINGASGGVGSFAVQIAKSMGATVTGVCSTPNVPLVSALGADAVIDYRREDYTEQSERYDVVIDMVGNHSPAKNHTVLEDGGRYVLVGGPKGDWFAPLKRPLQAAWTSLFVDETLVTMLARMKADDVATLAAMLADQRIVPAIDRRYSLADAPEAIRYSETGRARGKIILLIE